MKKLFFLSLVILVFFSCKRNSNNINLHLSIDDAIWIGDDRNEPVEDSLFYLDNPAPLFRKEFISNHKIESATLLITAAGYYKATINGEKIGKNVLSPAWTDFSKRIYYSQYDITSEIKLGNNCLGVTLGNGFYNPLPLKMFGRRNLRENLSVGNPTFIAKLLIKYNNGKSESIISDNSWKYNYGPITRNNVYLGEVYEANREIEGWELSGFKDEEWKKVKVHSDPGGILQKAFFPPVQITQRIIPVECISHNEKFIVDMGVNFTGTYKIKISGKKGDTIVFRFGERIYDDGSLNPMTTVCGQIKHAGQGGPGAPDIAWQTDRYIFGNETEVWYQPEFTFHTYRYMEISGLKKAPLLTDIEGLALNSNVENKNNFNCSSELLNSIQEATERTFLANLVSVQSDCAAREKFGYGGDLNATNESFIYNFNMQAFYRKTIYDWVDATNDSCFVDTAPYVGIKYCGISWESAFLTTQYKLYLYYNNTEIINELYELDKKWMDKVARIHPDKIIKSGLSDHESLEPVPVELTGTCHYLQSARIMEGFAKLMNDNKAEIKYRNLAAELEKIIREKFWDNPVLEKINRQTLFSTLLYHDVIPDRDLDAAKDSLLRALKNGPSQHFNTGIFGTKYILEALSKSGNPGSVYNVVNSTEYPGWGFMIEQGATTIWETWKESDNIYSNCHPMFGSVTEWFYRWLGGIQPNSEYPGFEQFVISPFIPKDLEFVQTNYFSPFGEIVSNWKKSRNNSIVFEIKIPEGSSAKFQITSMVLGTISVENKNANKTFTIDDFILKTDGLKLSAGDYEISAVFK